MVGWNGSGYGWHRTRRQAAGGPSEAGSWTLADTATIVLAAVIRWELAAAFVGLKLWQQASGHRGSAFAFARERWEGLVGVTRSLISSGALPSLRMGERSMGLRGSGNRAFDRWRHAELARIEAERDRLRVAERDFAAYRDELLHAKDREDFDRFMQAQQMRSGEGRPELRRNDIG